MAQGYRMLFGEKEDMMEYCFRIRFRTDDGFDDAREDPVQKVFASDEEALKYASFLADSRIEVTWPDEPFVIVIYSYDTTPCPSSWDDLRLLGAIERREKNVETDNNQEDQEKSNED